MTTGGSISGEVTTGAGHPQSRVCVSASDETDFSFGEAFTNNQGRYTIKNLSSGSYQITFFDCSFGRGHVQLGTATLPQPVKLVAPHAVTAVNEKLSPAGSISGTVLGGPGATPQSGVCVVAVPQGASAAIEYSATLTRPAPIRSPAWPPAPTRSTWATRPACSPTTPSPRSGIRASRRRLRRPA